MIIHKLFKTSVKAMVFFCYNLVFVGTNVYMTFLNDTTNDSLECKIEKNNKFDHFTVTLIHDDCLK